MLNNNELFTQSLNDHLYYLRSIREFCITIELTFYKNNQSFIDKARDYARKCEELGRKAIGYANNSISKEALDNEIYFTKYTLDIELLTEKLFGVSLNTNITQEELKLAVGNTPNIGNINKIKELNKEVLEFVEEFQNFCKEIRDDLKNVLLFSYSYIDYFDYMITDVNTYILDLNRLISNESVSPVYAIGYEYYVSTSLAKTASFIRGWINPIHQDIFDLANYYLNNFNTIVNEYLKTSFSPNVQNNINRRLLNLISEYQSFVSNMLDRLLKGEIYFITPPITIDNIYTSVNFYKYILSIQNKLI